jgi:hypothetical protein
MNVILGEGLAEIGDAAFAQCASLDEISIPNAIKVIKDSTFYGCLQLTTANLGKGLKEIGEEVFSDCTLLHEILIPPAVKGIKDRAFLRCRS